MEGEKIVTCREMARIEKLSLEEGALSEEYMENAGCGIADLVEELVAAWDCTREVVVIAGKGNNGGDAFVAGRYLLERGFHVMAFHLFDSEESSPLCRENRLRFAECGGEVVELFEASHITCPPNGVILDGIFGTGFHSKTEGHVHEVIEHINGLGVSIIAIDIPSALEVEARATLYLGLPKMEFFTREAFGKVGELYGVDFGIEERYLEEAEASAYLYDEGQTGALMPPIQRCRHKYEAGYVVALAGSKGMSGAAFLSALAALRMGAGIVRLYHNEGMEGGGPYEVITRPFNAEEVLHEAQRASSFLIGPGLGFHEGIKEIVPRLSVPCVIDADGLMLLNEIDIFAPHIITPHRGEMQRLLGCLVDHQACQAYSEERGATIVLKGAPTMIFHPGCAPLVVTAGDPGMATAGSGDVLTGFIAALLAQGMDLREAAVLGVYLHGRAGEVAARRHTSYGMIASDIIQSVNLVIPSSREV